jgi:hypothetical protein
MPVGIYAMIRHLCDDPELKRPWPLLPAGGVAVVCRAIKLHSPIYDVHPYKKI